MKNIIHIQNLPGHWRMVIAAMVLFTGLFAFNSRIQPGQGLAGTWTGNSFDFRQIKGPDIKAMIEGGKNLHMGGQLILKADNTYRIKDPQGNVNGQGSWAENDGKSFSTTDEGGETTVYEIVALEADRLVTKHEVAMDTPDGQVRGVITLGYKR